MPAGDLDLTGELEAALVAVPGLSCSFAATRVIPGDPANSLLYQKLGTPVDCGDAMPVGRSLPADEIQCVADWISALDDPTCETCNSTVCIDLQSDPAHCGSCDQACPEGATCVEGSCSCDGATQSCSGECVDTQRDPQHCGACDAACAQDEFCVAGSCNSGCDPLTRCGSSCVDLNSDAEHCGACNMACDTGQSCVDGLCGCAQPLLTYTADIEPLFVSACTGRSCHEGARAKASLDLAEGQGYAELVGALSIQCAGVLVEPGNVDASYLVDKLRGTNLCSGTLMPKSAPAWSEDQIALVQAWICHGAALE